MMPSKFAIAGIVMAAIYAAPANAQATRTWVSGVGNDVNPCSRTAPCKTFAGAISKTAPNGKINCLDPGGFGAVTITKSIEIDCFAFPGGILSSLVNGIIITLNPNLKVIIRGVEIHGAGNGLDGVRILQPADVTLDKVFITAITGDGVEVANSTGLVQLFLNEVSIRQANRGVVLSPTGTGAAVAVLDGVQIQGVTTSGVETTTNNTFASITRSNISGLPTGSAVFTSAGNGKITVTDSTIQGSSFGIRAVGAGSIIRINNNTIVDNNTSISIGAGTTVATGQNNKVEPPGTVPNAVFTNQ